MKVRVTFDISDEERRAINAVVGVRGKASRALVHHIIGRSAQRTVDWYVAEWALWRASAPGAARPEGSNPEPKAGP